MNLGIGDAVNLGWKLAAVLQQDIDESLLDTYESERKRLAESVVSRTDNAFKVMASHSKISEWIRTGVVPLAAKVAGKSEWIQSQMFKVLSQLYISYDDSLLNSHATSKLKSGTRLPFAEGEQFEFTRESGWQLHYFNELPESVNEQGYLPIEMIRRRWTDKTRQAGFEKDCFYLVRPDGYIGWTGNTESFMDLNEYIAEWII